MFLNDYKAYLAETRGAFLLTEEWGFMVYEFRNNYLCMCDLFVDWHYRCGDTLVEILDLVETMAREKKLEFIGFKLAANIHNFEKLVELAESFDFERVTVQPEYILFLRRTECLEC